jgi:enoyl-CoA hydratase/carnithine racemase
VNGPADGGGSAIALASDFGLASEIALYDFFFYRLGLSVADVGVPWLLNRAIGPVMTNYYLLTAGSIDAQTGRRLGLFTDVVRPDPLLSCARDSAQDHRGAGAHPARLGTVNAPRGRHGFHRQHGNGSLPAGHAFQLPVHKRRIVSRNKHAAFDA